MPTGTFIKDNGQMANKMAKEIIFTIRTMRSTRVTGKKVKSKALES